MEEVGATKGDGVMVATGNPATGDPTVKERGSDLAEQVDTYLLGKAYIAVLKHQLAKGETSNRRLKDVFDEAYRQATILAQCGPSDTAPPTEEVHTYVVGKAYIAVLKHQLANGTASDRRLKSVFDEAYREALALAKCETSGVLGPSDPKRT
jgi:hypothetical protein